ncbi:MAG: helicase C-terminal domain-containing protein [Microcystaceae cyanobacterium]
MELLEVQTHRLLKEWLRHHAPASWPHALTLGRWTALALRLEKTLLVQTGTLPRRYSSAYLLPLLLWSEPWQLVVTPERQRQLQEQEIPALQDWLQGRGEAYAVKILSELNILTPRQWFETQAPLTTLIEQADYVEDWARDYGSYRLQEADWQGWQQVSPALAETIRNAKIKLTKAFFSRPVNPYNYYLLTAEEQQILEGLIHPLIQAQEISLIFAQFWQVWQAQPDNYLLWAQLERDRGQFCLQLSPIDLKAFLAPYWRSPLILLGGFLDTQKEATLYRQNLGLGELLCLKFTPNRQTESIQVYVPDGLPLPNTPEFKGVLFLQIQRLIQASLSLPLTIVILIDDLPLKLPLATQLAAEFGTRVKVEQTQLKEGSILISSWSFWCQYQSQLPTPHLLILGTLPLPSLEHPLVASRVNYCKRHRQDWFRHYLLPTALKALQQAVMPLRENQGAIAIFDARVNSRSYSLQILGALEPYAKSNYIDPLWFC